MSNLISEKIEEMPHEELKEEIGELSPQKKAEILNLIVIDEGVKDWKKTK